MPATSATAANCKRLPHHHIRLLETSAFRLFPRAVFPFLFQASDLPVHPHIIKVIPFLILFVGAKKLQVAPQREPSCYFNKAEKGADRRKIRLFGMQTFTQDLSSFVCILGHLLTLCCLLLQIPFLITFWHKVSMSTFRSLIFIHEKNFSPA